LSTSHLTAIPLIYELVDGVKFIIHLLLDLTELLTGFFHMPQSQIGVVLTHLEETDCFNGVSRRWYWEGLNGGVRSCLGWMWICVGRRG
jgi:hypothetical protein